MNTGIEPGARVGPDKVFTWPFFAHKGKLDFPVERKGRQKHIISPSHTWAVRYVRDGVIHHDKLPAVEVFDGTTIHLHYVKNGRLLRTIHFDERYRGDIGIYTRKTVLRIETMHRPGCSRNLRDIHIALDSGNFAHLNNCATIDWDSYILTVSPKTIPFVHNVTENVTYLDATAVHRIAGDMMKLLQTARLHYYEHGLLAPFTKGKK